MTNTKSFGQLTTRGVAPLFIILAVVVIGAATYAVVNRNVLKSYFETGDKPTQEQFGTMLDSATEEQPDEASPQGSAAARSAVAVQAKVLSANQPEFKLDAVQDVTFRWTPLVPKPQEPVTYKLRVWQLMQGQNGTAAMRTNNPVVTKDVVDVSEVTVSNLYTGPCKPPYLCDFVWSVEAMGQASDGTGTR